MQYTFNFAIQYYRYLIQIDTFYLTQTTEIYIEKNLRSTNVCKPAGIDGFLDRFLKDS